MIRAMTTAALLSATLLAAGCASLKLGTSPSDDAAETRAAGAAAAAAVIETQRSALSSAMADTGVSVLRSSDDELQVNVPSDFSFGSDHAEILPVGRPVLDSLAANLVSPMFLAMHIRIVGYTDNLGSEASNDALSLARANSVRRRLEAKGVAAGRIEVLGRGERDPLVGNEKAYGRALNRRVEIYLREPAVKP
jgi:outer membrane protein OmpA-like peptidoglycan-associated protein